MKKRALPRVSHADIDLGLEFVRSKLDNFKKHHPTKTNRDRISALLTIKKVHGLLSRKQKLRGNQPRDKNISATDLAVIADIAKYGTLKKSVAVHYAAGKLSKMTEERSHYARISAARKM